MRRMKRVTTLVTLVGLFVIVMFAASVQGTPKIDPVEVSSPNNTLTEPPPPTGVSGPQQAPEPANATATTIISIVLVLLGIAILVFFAIVLARALLRAWRDRPLRVRDGDDVSHDVESVELPSEDDVVAPAIRRGIDGALRLIDERATPTDAIVAAWVGLEESASDAGLVRGVSETPSEFALRIITRRTGISEAAQVLLRLYERVRFGGYVADENDRADARMALKTIEEGWR